MVIAWICAGKPYHGRRLPSFESWSEVVGGVLEVAGIVGFLQHSRSELLSQDDRDLENLLALWAATGGCPMTAGNLYALAQQSGAVPRAVVHAKQPSQALGMLLSKHDGEVINDLLLTSRYDAHAKQMQYLLYAMTPAPAGAAAAPAPTATSQPATAHATAGCPATPAPGAGTAGAFQGPPHQEKEETSNQISPTWIEVPASTRTDQEVWDAQPRRPGPTSSGGTP
jgi:hypothetical protein